MIYICYLGHFFPKWYRGRIGLYDAKWYHMSFIWSLCGFGKKWPLFREETTPVPHILAWLKARNSPSPPTVALLARVFDSNILYSRARAFHGSQWSFLLMIPVAELNIRTLYTSMITWSQLRMIVGAYGKRVQTPYSLVAAAVFTCVLGYWIRRYTPCYTFQLIKPRCQMPHPFR